METYAALLNLKVIVPSSKTNYVAVESHYWQDLLELRLSTVEVDETWYLSEYPDVAQAVKKGVVKSAAQHYYRSGYYEHRMPYHIEFDSEWYLKTYTDIAEAVRQGTFSSAEEHFKLIGYKEGRLPHANFALRKRREMSLAG